MGRRQNGALPQRMALSNTARRLATPEPVAPDPLDELAARSHRLATVVSATSRRRDVRETRARVLLLLLELRCPLGRSPRLRWYVPGAVARLGWRGILDRWRERFGEDPPAERTIRGHLGALEGACAIQRQPGDFLPVRRDYLKEGRRPRHPDTLHVLEDERDATWWATTGEALLERNPDARRDPRAWKRLFARWRELARTPELPFELPEDPPAVAHAPERVQAVLVASTARGALASLSGLAAAGLRLGARERLELARDPARLAGAAGLLWRALDRGDRVRNPEGWLLRAFRSASSDELAAAARAAMLEHGRPEPAPPVSPVLERATLELEARRSTEPGTFRAGLQGLLWELENPTRRSEP